MLESISYVTIVSLIYIEEILHILVHVLHTHLISNFKNIYRLISSNMNTSKAQSSSNNALRLYGELPRSHQSCLRLSLKLIDTHCACKEYRHSFFVFFFLIDTICACKTYRHSVFVFFFLIDRQSVIKLYWQNFCLFLSLIDTNSACKPFKSKKNLRF